MRKHLPLILLIAGLLLILILGGLKLYRLAQIARSFQGRLEQAQALAAGGRDEWKDLDLQQARDLIHGTRADFIALKTEVEPWLWLAPAASWVPTYGPDTTTAPQLLEMGDAGTQTAVLLSDGLFPLLEQLQEGNLSLEAIGAGLDSARPELAAAQVGLERIAAARAAIPPGDYSHIVQKLLDKLDEYLPLAQTGLRGAQLVPEAMGLDGPRTYLLIAQNEDEIRPTGGFFSSVGLLTMDGGEIVSLSFEDSYAVDDWQNHPYPELPQPYQQIMGDGIWLFRDANWSPDWPTSARQAIALYQISCEVPIDGVIAADQRAVQLLVGPLAPLEVGEGFELVTAENVQTFMRQAWINPAEGEAEDWIRYRKAFIGSLAAAMQEQLLNNLGSIDLFALAVALQTALDEKHILLYFEDPALDEVVRQVGWDGALRSSPGDYLMVVDANMGFNKVAPVIQQQIEYRVSLMDLAAPRAQVTLIYTHTGNPRSEMCQHQSYYGNTLTGYADLVDRCYWDYVRVYPPAGATPLNGSRHPLSGDLLTSGRDWPGEMVVAQEPSGRLSLANLFLLRWGERQVAQFEYQLPPEVTLRTEDGIYRYQLLVQKQPSTVGAPLRVVVQLPPGAELLATTPTLARSGDELVFDLALQMDQEILVEWTNERIDE